MIEFVELRAKTYSHLIDDNKEDKKAKRTKKCHENKTQIYQNRKIAQQQPKLIVLKNHKNLIKNNELILKIQQRFKCKRHNDFTEEINRIALNSNDDKRMQSNGLIETNVYGANKDLIKIIIRRNSKIIKRYRNDYL